MKIKTGDKVAYKAAFLRSIGATCGELGHARGTVTGITEYGANFSLADIDWGSPDIPAKVNVGNLCKINGSGFSTL